MTNFVNLTPDQDLDHLLHVVSGDNGMHNLMFRFAAIQADEYWERGSILSVNQNGEAKAGCGDLEMPMWTQHAVNGRDFDVSSDIGNSAGGTMSAFPATGGYELKTTEFDENQVYYPNDFLTPMGGADRGKITKAAAAWGNALVCGVVSRAVLTDAENQQVLHFWPVFLPKIAGATVGSGSSS
jgi:hypothetical protein